MARFGPRADGPPIFGPGQANLQAQNRAKMGRQALTGPWKTGPGRATAGPTQAYVKYVRFLHIPDFGPAFFTSPASDINASQISGPATVILTNSEKTGSF